MVYDFDVRLFFENLKATKPPYECPAEGCGRVYKTYAGIQFHLFNYDHDNPDGKNGQTPQSQPRTAPGGAKRWHHRQIRRRSQSPSDLQSPQSDRNTSPPLSPLNSPSSKSFRHIIEVNLGGQVHRINILEPMDIVYRSKAKCETDGRTENIDPPVESSVLLDCLSNKTTEPEKTQDTTKSSVAVLLDSVASLENTVATPSETASTLIKDSVVTPSDKCPSVVTETSPVAMETNPVATEIGSDSILPLVVADSVGTEMTTHPLDIDAIVSKPSVDTTFVDSAAEEKTGEKTGEKSCETENEPTVDAVDLATSAEQDVVSEVTDVTVNNELVPSTSTDIISLDRTASSPVIDSSLADVDSDVNVDSDATVPLNEPLTVDTASELSDVTDLDRTILVDAEHLHAVTKNTEQEQDGVNSVNETMILLDIEQNEPLGEVLKESVIREEPVNNGEAGSRDNDCAQEDMEATILLNIDTKDEQGVKDVDEKMSEMSLLKDGTKSLPKSAEAGTVVKSGTTTLPVAEFQVLEDYIRAPRIPASIQSSEYYKYTEKTAEDLDAVVEYDMDEEDYIWLELFNEKRTLKSVSAVPHETFEALMDRFEKEAYFRTRTSPHSGGGASGGGGTTGLSIDDDAVCAICLDGECQNTNVILFCDLCNLAVHQECYGVPFVPEGQWLCRRCLQSPSRPVDCCLCPNRGGAFKQTNDGRWAHVACALWIPEVTFANHVFLEPIDGLERIPPARRRLTCCVCRRRGAGACIQCHRPNCYIAFHVTCAQLAGLHMKITPVKASGNESGSSGTLGAVRKTAYCDLHTPGIADETSNPSEAKAQARERMKQARKILAERRRAAPVVSIPVIPQHRLAEISVGVNVEDCEEFVNRLKSYWTLKRRSRNGVPLLRRLQTSHMSRHKDQEQSSVARHRSQSVTIDHNKSLLSPVRPGELTACGSTDGGQDTSVERSTTTAGKPRKTRTPRSKKVAEKSLVETPVTVTYEPPEVINAESFEVNDIDNVDDEVIVDSSVEQKTDKQRHRTPGKPRGKPRAEKTPITESESRKTGDRVGRKRRHEELEEQEEEVEEELEETVEVEKVGDKVSEEGETAESGRAKKLKKNKASEVESEEESMSMSEQLVYWKQLRQDLERVRLLLELIRKREKMKATLMRIHQGALTLQLKPFAVLLHETLDQLQKRDIHGFFAEPVSVEQVPDYLETITNPMDFSTMRHKIDTQSYSSVTDFYQDFQLIINNCTTYNAKDTIFYKSAIRLRNQGELIIAEAFRIELRVGYDPDTWLHLLDRPDNTAQLAALDETLPLMPEFDESTSLDEQLQILLGRLEQAENTHPTVNSELMRQLHKELKRVRHQLASQTASSAFYSTENSATRHSSRLNMSDMSPLTTTTPRLPRKRPGPSNDGSAASRKPKEPIRRSARKRLHLCLGDFNSSKDEIESDSEDFDVSRSTEGAAQSTTEGATQSTTGGATNSTASDGNIADVNSEVNVSSPVDGDTKANPPEGATSVSTRRSAVIGRRQLPIRRKTQSLSDDDDKSSKQTDD